MHNPTPISSWVVRSTLMGSRIKINKGVFTMLKLSQLVILSALFLSGCASSPLVQSDFDKSADFSKFNTFKIDALQTGSRYEYVNDKVDKAIEMNLQKKGLRLVAQGKADIDIRYITQVEDVNNLDMQIIPTEKGGFLTRYLPDWSTQGSMLVNIVDNATNKVIWKASTERKIDPLQLPTQERINTVIDEVFATFPPRH